MHYQENPYYPLIKKEKWDIELLENEVGNKDYRVVVYGKDYPLVHPYSIHGKIYSDSNSPEIKFKHLKRMHDLMWPNEIWHQWTEDRFWAHCEAWRIITLAAGASSGKSRDAAKLAILFQFSAMLSNATVVASTTLKSLQGRIWGYITALLKESVIDFSYQAYRGNNPHILFDKRDTIHGMFAVAAKRGDSEESIKDWIGKHPKKGLLIVLDECTDMPAAVLGAMANLETSQWFQLIGIGNSCDENDLHGALSTPLVGWDGIDPEVDKKWPTKHDRGVCLFFSCYDSPAIKDPDPEKRKKLGTFLATEEKIERGKRIYGENSPAFWRFIIGFWNRGSSDDTVISPKFIRELNVTKRAEWGGVTDLIPVAGLDPAFSTGGDHCILRLAMIGKDIHGDTLIDFYGENLLFYIGIVASATTSAEAQIAKQVIEILREHGCPLNRLVIDANGQGRALGEVIRLTAGSIVSPLKIYSTKSGTKSKDSFDVIIKNPTDMWFVFKEFMQADMIRGLDGKSVSQFTHRRVVTNEKTLKREIQSKRDFKASMSAISPSLAHSPDEADASVLCLQSAIMTAGLSLKNISDEGITKLATNMTPEHSAIVQARLNAIQNRTASKVKKYTPNAAFKAVGSLPRLKIR